MYERTELFFKANNGILKEGQEQHDNSRLMKIHIGILAFALKSLKGTGDGWRTDN